MIDPSWRRRLDVDSDNRDAAQQDAKNAPNNQKTLTMNELKVGLMPVRAAAVCWWRELSQNVPLNFKSQNRE